MPIAATPTTRDTIVDGDPENWVRILERLDALEPRRVVPGHGPVAGPEAIDTIRR